MSSKIITVLSNSDDFSKTICNKLISTLIKHGYTPCFDKNENAELIIAIGGDGSFLHAVHNNDFANIPFFGINTGTLGFYPELSPDNIDNFIKMYVSGKYKINNINVVEAIISYDDKFKRLYAINEFVIKKAFSKTIHLEIYIEDNHLQTISGDGVIISTPLGSSAYNYSAGGSLVYPSLRTLQLTPVCPIFSNVYRSLNSSVIVPPEFEITIVPESKYSKSATLYADGIEYAFENINHAKFSISDKTIKKLTIGNYNYWDVIKDKFL